MGQPLAEVRFNPNHSKSGRFAPGGGGGAVSAKIGQRHEFTTGKEHGTGKTVANFKGNVARKAPDGRLMVNAGTNAKPRWVETHEKSIKAPAKKAGPRGESKRTYKERLTPDETKAIDAYMGENYKSINGALRSGKEPSAITAKRIDALDSAVSKGVIEKDTRLFRAMHTDQHPASLVGKSFRDHGFVSTSEGSTLPLRMASSRKGGIYARIDVPAGTNAGFLHKFRNQQSVSKYDSIKESEVLLGRGKQFRVKGAKQGNDGMWTMDLELIAE